jgi:hypothetical protein
MADDEIGVRATPDEVFAVLLDARAYAGWVVGARRIRGVDASWPDPGSSFHHALGAGPLELKDDTKVLAVDAPRSLCLEARFRPAGRARIELTVEPAAPGSRIRLREQPVGGPATALRGRIGDRLIGARNVVSLHRLRRLVERRGPQPASNGPGLGTQR